jgi:hypothetical protein
MILLLTDFGGFHDAREQNSRFLAHNFLTPGDWRSLRSSVAVAPFFQRTGYAASG